MIQLKRVYEKPSRKDGLRILVDRLWPRGLTKRLRGGEVVVERRGPKHRVATGFGHDPARWKQFQTRYRKELGEERRPSNR